MKKNILLISILLSTSIGCKKSDNEKSNPLLTGEWIFTSIQNIKTKQTLNYPDSISVKEFIVFTDSASILSWSGICNYGWGTYSINGNYINFPDGIFDSKIGCFNNWDGYLYDNLDSAFEYNINAIQLEIKSRGSFNLFFEKKQ